MDYKCSYVDKNVCKWLGYEGWWFEALDAPAVKSTYHEVSHLKRH